MGLGLIYFVCVCVRVCICIYIYNEFIIYIYNEFIVWYGIPRVTSQFISCKEAVLIYIGWRFGF